MYEIHGQLVAIKETLKPNHKDYTCVHGNAWPSRSVIVAWYGMKRSAPFRMRCQRSKCVRHFGRIRVALSADPSQRKCCIHATCCRCMVSVTTIPIRIISSSVLLWFVFTTRPNMMDRFGVMEAEPRQISRRRAVN